MTMITRPKLIATPTWPSASVFASTMIAPQPAKTSANVPIASASARPGELGRHSIAPLRRSTQQHVAPHAVVLAEVARERRRCGTRRLVQRDARVFSGKMPGLHRPDPSASARQTQLR